MVPVLVERTGIPAAEKVHSVTEAQRRRLLEVRAASTATGPRPGGGGHRHLRRIKASEINPTTLNPEGPWRLFCRGGTGCRCLHRRLQSAKWLNHGHAAGDAADIGRINPQPARASPWTAPPGRESPPGEARLLQAGLLYVDTRAIYRTVGLRAGPEWTRRTAAVTAHLVGWTARRAEVWRDGRAHSKSGRRDADRCHPPARISRYTSGVSAIPAVRAFLRARQRQRDMARSTM